MSEEEISMKRFDECIKKINEYSSRIKAIDAKIAEKRKMLKQARTINVSSINLLPLVW